MRNLVRHNARHFSFFIGCQNQSRVHIEESARQRHGIDHIGINHLNGEWYLGVRVPNQVLPNAVHILRNHRIID